MLIHLEGRLQVRDMPVQAWAVLSPNAMEIAVYAHSPNPNAEDFPARLVRDDSAVEAPSDLLALIPMGYQILAIRNDANVSYVVQRRELISPLQPLGAL